MPEDRPWQPFQIPLSGKLRTAIDGTELGEGDFQTLKNMRYGEITPKSVTGMTKINTSVMNATYLKPRTGFHFRKAQPSESHVLVQAWNSGLTASRVLQNTTAIPSQGNFSSTVAWTDTSGCAIGKFSNAPDGCVAYTNEKEACIWGGDEYRCAGFLLKSTAVAASGTLTSDATIPTDGDTVTIDTKTYTFKTALTPTEGEVLIGANAAAALDNLKSAINHTGTPDTDYSCAAVHPTVTATTNTDTTQVVVAKTAGTSGNAIATTEASTHLAWGAATLAGGLDEGASYLYDYTEEINNILTTDVATLNQSTSYVYIASTRPIKGVKFYVGTANTNAATVGVNYWASSAWTAVTNLDDQTDTVAGKTLSGNGWIVFDTTVTVAKPKLINKVYMYWYQFTFTGISTTTTVYYVTVDAPFQAIVDIWDGEPRVITSYFRYVTSYIDESTQVLEEDYVSGDVLTYSNIGGMTSSYKLYVGFSERMTGVDIILVTGKVNTNASVLTVKYWNGSAWTSVGTIDDGTKTTATTLNKTGSIVWDSPAKSSEFKNAIAGNNLGYFYEITVSATLSADVYIDKITGIPAQKSIKGYAFPVIWNNSLWLLNEVAGRKNSAISSMGETVCVFNGENSVTPDAPMVFGNEEPLIAGGTLFSRFSGDIYESMIITKRGETWLVDGTGPSDYKKYKVSDSYGCVASGTFKSCSTGYEMAPGLMKHVLIWQAESAIIIFDGVSVQSISDDIKNYFDRMKTECIPASMLSKSEAFFDESELEYHWKFGSGASATDLNKEFVYSIRKKAWFEIDRGTGKYLQIGFSVKDTNGRNYCYGGIDTGYIERLEYGTTFDGTDITSQFKTGDIAFGTWGIETKVRNLTHIVKAKSNTTNEVTMTHYGDTVNSSSQTQSFTVNSSTKRVAFETKQVDWGNNIFHSFNCSLTTDDEDISYEPIGFSGYMQAIREKRI